MGAAEPLVCCICLTADRQEMTEQAIKCFQAQTYPRKHMLIFDTGHAEFQWKGRDERIGLVLAGDYRGKTIGALRNVANGLASTKDILVHVDSDDWSHPNRLTEQVALLQASGADAVGYNEMLFWRTNGEMKFDERFGDRGIGSVTEDEDSITIETGALVECGEAWLYSNPRPNYALGTSLMYKRALWERCPFTDGPKPEGTSEYHHWFGPGSGVRVHSVSSIGQVNPPPFHEPRIIARIHGGNTGQYDLEKLIAGGSQEWKRVPAWDNRVRSLLEGK